MPINLSLRILLKLEQMIYEIPDWLWKPPMRENKASSRNLSKKTSIWESKRPVSEANVIIIEALGRIRKKFIFFILWVSAFIFTSIMYTKLVAPEFISTAQILIQPHIIINDGPENLRHFYQLVLDSDQCETELRILGSQKLLYQVFEEQGLANSESLRRPDGMKSFISSSLDWLQRWNGTNSEVIEAFHAFVGRVRTRRLGLSYVIEISYRAQTAEQAAKVVNAIASTYAAYRLRSVLAREHRRGAYLEGRLSSIFVQIMAAKAGGRLGVIPSDVLPDADVRLLGPANPPLGIAYPKMIPLVLITTSLGLVSGLLIILLSPAAPMRHINRTVGSVVNRRT